MTKIINNTYTVQLSCDVTFIVPRNWESMSNDDKKAWIANCIHNNIFDSFEISYCGEDEVNEIIDATF